jgi:hypothetical protein
MNILRKTDNIKDNESCRIADAANTYNWALTIIKSKGYKIFLEPDEREDYYGNYWAIKGQREFIGADPLRLLGIISIWETLGDNWRTQDKLRYENLYDEINRKAFPNSVADIESLTDIDFAELVADYRIFFSSLDKIDKLPLNITRQKFFEIINNYYTENETDE